MLSPWCRPPRFLLIAATALSLSGCVVGDGVAHLVKLTQNGGAAGQKDAPAPAPVQAPASREEPPPPMAAGPVDRIKVEQLPPSRP